MTTTATSPATIAVETQLQSQLELTHLEIIDNSWMHAGHAGNTGGSHLAITLVSPAFEGLNLLERHRMVHKVLKAAMAEHIHALELKTLSPTEWAEASA